MTKRERNKLIEKARQLVFEALSFMEEARDEENESLEQWPESLQETDRYYDASNRADAIENAHSDLEAVYDAMTDILEGNI